MASLKQLACLDLITPHVVAITDTRILPTTQEEARNTWKQAPTMLAPQLSNIRTT